MQPLHSFHEQIPRPSHHHTSLHQLRQTPNHENLTTSAPYPPLAPRAAASSPIARWSWYLFDAPAYTCFRLYREGQGCDKGCRGAGGLLCMILLHDYYSMRLLQDYYRRAHNDSLVSFVELALLTAVTTSTPSTSPLFPIQGASLPFDSPLSRSTRADTAHAHVGVVVFARLLRPFPVQRMHFLAVLKLHFVTLKPPLTPCMSAAAAAAVTHTTSTTIINATATTTTTNTTQRSNIKILVRTPWKHF